MAKKDILTYSVTDKTQSDGDQTIDISSSYTLPQGRQRVPKGTPLDNWQAHIEIRLTSNDNQHTPDAGTATIYGVPKGGTTQGKIILAEIDLTSTAVLGLMDGWSGVFDTIVVSPSSLDADCEYDCIITAW